jgi:hypothetical protein
MGVEPISVDPQSTILPLNYNYLLIFVLKREKSDSNRQLLAWQAKALPIKLFSLFWKSSLISQFKDISLR